MRNKIALGLLAVGLLCGLYFVYGAVESTRVHLNGATVSTGGVLSVLGSLLASGGFSVSGVIVWALQFLKFGSGQTSENNVKDVVELSAAFYALIKDKGSKAAQRRFVFALCDAADLITGVTAVNVNGVITITYSGFVGAGTASPTPAAVPSVGQAA